MAERFSAFSFVDRITDIEPRTRARGRYAVPAGLPHFSPCLVAEAVGQLAAWLAMAGVDFRRRPVAALTGEARILGEAVPGRSLDLGVEVESLNDDAILYRGRAQVDEEPIVELERCIGPMLPMEDFDAPDAARERFILLTGAGARPDGFPGVDELPVVVIDGDAHERVHAALQVPACAAFFLDHFPRRPVFPATLLLDAQIRLALDLVADGPRRFRPSRVTDVKMRAFILPGQVVDIVAEILSQTPDAATVKLGAKVDGRRVASARVEFVEWERS